MQIEVDPKPILARPSDGLEEVFERESFHEGFLVPGFNHPPADGKPHPIQASRGDVCEVLLRDEGLVMILNRGRSLGPECLT